MKLLLIDNHPETVDSVELTVGIAWPDATTLFASSGDAGIYAADSEEPNLVVLEVDLPDMDGFSVCREIRRFSDVPIIMLTDRAKQVDIVRGLDVGADDYIIKPLNPLVFMARVKAVLKRSDPMPSLVEDRVFEYGDLKVDCRAAKVTLGGRETSLTPTEYQLLRQLIKTPGRIVPSQNLINLIWGKEHVGETPSLKEHIRSLRKKLGEDAGAPKYIFTELNKGYGLGVRT